MPGGACDPKATGIEDYIHRSGRVGRADCLGLCISLVSTVKEKVWFFDKRKWCAHAHALCAHMRTRMRARRQPWARTKPAGRAPLSAPLRSPRPPRPRGAAAARAAARAPSARPRTPRHRKDGRKKDTSLAKVGRHGGPEGGGCCIWYNEPKLLEEVRKRLGKTEISVLDSRSFKLPSGTLLGTPASRMPRRHGYEPLLPRRKRKRKREGEGRGTLGHCMILQIHIVHIVHT